MNSSDVRIVFVLPKGYESELQTSEEMQQAFEVCRQNSISADWSREQDCADLELKKTDLVVFQSFEGEAFQKIKQTKSVRIVGPWCLLTCLIEGNQIPNLLWPLYSVAMLGCTISCSAVTKLIKREIQEKVEYMAGIFSPSLTKECTHLITDTVKSEKYIKAAEAGVQLVLNSWVKDVWQTAQKANVHCNHEQFKKHHCPPFHKLVVCSTGFSPHERSLVEKLIVENGGEYREQLHLSSTDILICDSSSTSAKYKAAIKRNIKCVTFKWITDSVEKGYAMPEYLYKVNRGTSTPYKENDNLPNFSMISNIDNISVLQPCKSQLGDTIDMTDLQLHPSTPAKEFSKLKRRSDSNEHNDLVDGIDLKQVKQAGPFLDGCGIYLAGFGAEQRDKLCKVLNFSGATRYDDVTERVTHVLVGDSSCHDLKVISSRDNLKNCTLVSLQWLLDSIAKKQPVGEAHYLVLTITNTSDEPNSPLSKKGLHLLRTKGDTSSQTPVVQVDLTSESENDIVQQYLVPSISSPLNTVNTASRTDIISNSTTSSPICNRALKSNPSFNTEPPNEPAKYALPKPLEAGTSKMKPSDDNVFNTPPFRKLSTGYSERTPENRLMRNIQNTSDVCSQVTPVRSIMAEARKHNLLGTPKERLPFPKAWDHVDTPDTPLGAFIRPNPSPNLRKKMVRYLNTLPEYKPRRQSTPLSELKRQLWDKICPPKNTENAAKPEQPNFDMEVEHDEQDTSEKVSTPTNKAKTDNTLDNEIINNQLQQLQELITASENKQSNAKTNRRSTIPVSFVEVKDSQPNTIGWDHSMDCDDTENNQKPQPVFMFSGFEQDQRQLLTAQVESLGVVVTQLSNFDPLCTHLICPKPMRNEKVLASIASEKWILHTSYVAKCCEEGKLVDEEPFEFGNPKSKDNVHMQGNKENESRTFAMHYWRKEIGRRGYGPFHDMRAIIVAQKKDPIVRILEAGGGMVIEASPPYTEPVHATHCLLEQKSVKDNVTDYIPLVKQGIYCVSTTYISEYLQSSTNDVKDHIFPALVQYYNTS